jgi:hypothetical protein
VPVQFSCMEVTNERCDERPFTCYERMHSSVAHGREASRPPHARVQVGAEATHQTQQ